GRAPARGRGRRSPASPVGGLTMYTAKRAERAGHPAVTWWLAALASLAALLLLGRAAGRGQEPPAKPTPQQQIEELRKEVEALRHEVKALRKDLKAQNQPGQRLRSCPHALR